jgi:hypothetical protein
MGFDSAVSSLWRVVARSNIVVRLFGTFFAYREALNFISELWISYWAAFSSSLCLDCQASWSAWRASCDLNWRAILLGKTVSTFRVIISRTDIIVQFFRPLLSDGKCLRIVAKLRINRWTTYCANLCLNCKTLRSAWRSSANLDCWSLLFGHAIGSFRAVMSRTDIIVQFGWSLFTNRKAFYIVAEFLWRFVLTRSRSVYMCR